MGMWRVPGFRTSPLLPSVPLDGTDTVAGLRALERAARTHALYRTGPAAAAGPSARSYVRCPTFAVVVTHYV